MLAINAYKMCVCVEEIKGWGDDKGGSRETRYGLVRNDLETKALFCVFFFLLISPALLCVDRFTIRR